MSAGQFCGECEICGEWEPLELFLPLFCTHNPVYPFSIENPIIWYQSNRVLGLMATKKLDGRIEVMEEKMSDVHGEIASMKGDLQRLGPLEEKVDSMLKKLSLLERMEQMLQKLENLEKGAPPENKKEKGPILEGPKSELETARPEESSIGVGSTPREEPKEVSMPEESLRPPKITETDIIMKLERSRIEALTRRNRHHNGRRPILYWGELKTRLLDSFRCTQEGTLCE